jgi:hypothetical protein
MAKKKQTNVEVEEPQVQEKTAVKTAMVVKQPKAKDTWEIKDRQYYLLHELSPISYMLRASDIYYFDEKKGYERELKYTRNQKTPFVDEFPKNSDARLEHIIFRNGVLQVPKEKTVLQKLLSLYHPGLNKRYSEKDYQQEAENQLDWLEFEVQALNGLGDSIEKFTEVTGIKKIVDKVSKGKDCGCNKRKKALNKMFPYKNE